jgi:hypothetical protein
MTERRRDAGRLAGRADPLAADGRTLSALFLSALWETLPGPARHLLLAAVAAARVAVGVVVADVYVAVRVSPTGTPNPQPGGRRVLCASRITATRRCAKPAKQRVGV